MDGGSVVVGRVVAPWGIRGEMKVEVMTDFPDRFTPHQQVYVNGCPMTIEKSRWHKDMVVIKLERIDSIEAVEGMRGQYVEVPLESLHSLGDGEYYQFQVVGLEVWTTTGHLLGQVKAILATGNNDVYVVASESGEVLIPAVDDVVKSVDLGKGRITVEPIEGLL